MNKEPIIIGIAGGSGSGKSTLADNIQKEFNENIVLISHDNYYKSNDGIPYEERIKQNYDHPNSIETSLLIEQLKELKKGKSINKPIYSFVEHNRKVETEIVKPKKVIIVEGILIFENKELRDLMDIKIYVDTDSDIRFIRRLTRDVSERGRTIESVIDQFLSTVKPMHEQFVEPSKKNADIIVPEGGYNQVALNMIKEKIRRIIED